MGDSHAAKMAQCLADVAMKRPPRHGPIWIPDVDFSPDPNVGSPNKRTVANGLATLTAFDRKDFSTVQKGIDWFSWLSTQGFMLNESMTPEPVYRTLHSYPTLLVYGVAQAIMGDTGAAKEISKLPRSHFGWLLLGTGVSPGRKVLDHHRKDSDGCVLIGQGKPPKSGMIYVACAGMRAWVREGKTTASDFMFTENSAVSVIVAQGLGRRYDMKQEAVQRDCFRGYEMRFPGLFPWALLRREVEIAKSFAADPTDSVSAEVISTWLMAPDLDYAIDRFDQGDVVTAMLETQGSSTDPRMIDAAYRNGEIRQASCSDGIRSTKEPQVVELESVSYAVRRTNGGGEVQRIARPSGRLVHSVRSINGRVLFSADGDRGVVHPTPPDAVPPPVSRKPKRRRFEVS